MTPQLQELHTRFLWPFVYRRHASKDAAKLLLSFAERGKCPWSKVTLAPRQYTDEYLDHTAAALFGSSAGACEYLQVETAIADQWLSDLELQLSEDRWLGVRNIPGLGIEAFLSPHGVGILSIGLMPRVKGDAGLTVDDAKDFNYRIAQHRRRSKLIRLRRRHPANDSATWSKLDASQRASVEPIPGIEADIFERVASRGGEFGLGELAEALVAPLHPLDIRSAQQEFSVYTLARIHAPAAPTAGDVDLSRFDIFPEVAGLLSALAQVEEPGHAGSPFGSVTTEYAALNRLHICAVGTLGAAHVLGDQGGVPYDDQRLANVRDKYFPSFLAALLQRTTLNECLREASALEASHASMDAIPRLRRHLLQFSVGANPAEVSCRNAVQRFYEVSRAGLRVDATWSHVRTAIQDLDQAHAEAQSVQYLQSIENVQQQLAAVEGQSVRHLQAIEKLQAHIGILDYVIVSVYLVELVHLFIEAFDHEPKDAHSSFPASRPTLLALAVVTGPLIVYLSGRWIHRKGHDK